MRKSLCVVTITLLLTALIILSGCQQATDSGSTVYASRNTLYGVMTAAKVQETIEWALEHGEPLVLEDGLTIGAGIIDFKDARVTIRGAVTESAALTTNAAKATLVWEPGASWTVFGGGFFIFRDDADNEQVIGDGAGAALGDGTKVKYVERLQDIMSTATHAAVGNFTLGPVRDNDYSTGSPVNPRDYSSVLANIFVLDKLTIPGDGVKPTVLTGFRALGLVDITGTNTVALATAGITLATTATLTSSRGDVSLTLPVAGVLPKVTVEAGRNFTITGTAAFTSLTVAQLDGLGVLNVGATGSTPAIGITGGNGNIEFTRGITAAASIEIGGAVSSTFDGAVTVTSDAFTISSTGKTTFKSTLGLTQGSGGTHNHTIAGDVEFQDEVTRTSGNLILGGNVYLKEGKGITLTGVQTLTLTEGAVVHRGTDPVLEAVADTTLTPITLAKLAAEPIPGTLPNTPEEIAALKKITLSAAGLAVTSGNLQVADGGRFEVNAVKLSTTGSAGTLSLADGGTIALTVAGSVIGFGATDTVTATVVNDITITGAASVTTLKASGGVVTLGNSAIRGSAADAALILGGSASADIKIALAAGARTLNLDRVTLDLKDSGSLTLPEVSGAANIVSLTNKAKLLLNVGTTGAENENGFINGTKTGIISGGDRIAIGATDQNGALVHSIAHDAGAPVLITGRNAAAGTNHVVITKAATFANAAN